MSIQFSDLALALIIPCVIIIFWELWYLSHRVKQAEKRAKKNEVLVKMLWIGAKSTKKGDKNPDLEVKDASL